MPTQRANFPGVAKPTWSLYDIRDNPEWELARSMVMEYTDITGIEVLYYQRNHSIAEYDVVYGEDNMVGFAPPKTTKIIYEVGEEPNLWSNFGMMGGDVIIAHIPQGTFSRDVSAGINIIPNIGDAVYLPWYPAEGRLFEVAHVDDDDKIFQLSKLIWLLILKPFRYSAQSTSVDDMHSHVDPDGVTQTLLDLPPSASYGDNADINTESPVIDDYADVDKTVYGF
jgi:hypothetical protein